MVAPNDRVDYGTGSFAEVRALSAPRDLARRAQHCLDVPAD
jgi:hypothetical protein